MEHFIPMIVTLVLVLGLIGFSILRKHLGDEKRLKLRQMIHEERMQAMQKDVAVPALDQEIELRLHSDEGAAPRPNGSVKGVLWLRLVALCTGWCMLFTGIGINVAFALVKEEDLRNLWAVGFIPALAGLGLLLFYHLSRDYGESFANLEKQD